MPEYVFKEEFLEKTNKPLKQKNSRIEGCFKYLFVLSMVYLLIVLSSLVFSFAAPKTYDKIKQSYLSAVTQDDVTSNDISAFFNNIIDFLFQPRTNSSGGENFQGAQNVSQSAYVLTAPIHSPTKGVVTSEFGKRIHPISKKEGFHTGLDIASKLDTPIYSAFNGVVEKCGESEIYGNYIIMRHSDSLSTFYGHCNSINAKKGMRIRAGEVIAYMGSTGYSTGPHLHFEIRIMGIRVNPMYALKGNKDIEI